MNRQVTDSLPPAFAGMTAKNKNRYFMKSSDLFGEKYDSLRKIAR